MNFYLCKRHKCEHYWKTSTNVKAAPGYGYKVLQLLVPVAFYHNIFDILIVALGRAVYDEDFASCTKFRCEGSWAMYNSSETPGD